jgi:hypothetical protein
VRSAAIAPTANGGHISGYRAMAATGDCRRT